MRNLLLLIVLLLFSMSNLFAQDAEYLKSQQLQNLEKTTKDIEKYRTAIDSEKDIAKNYYNLGVVYYEAKQLKEAKASLLKCLEVDPSYVNANILLGDVCFESGQLEDASKYFEASVSLGNEDDYVYYRLGKIYNLLNVTDKAIESYTACVNLEPGIADFNFNLAVTYQIAGNNTMAVSYFKETVKLSSKHKKSLKYLVSVLTKTKEFGEAEAYGEKLIETYKDDAEAYYLMGVMYGEKGDVKKANEYNKLALELGYEMKNATIN